MNKGTVIKSVVMMIMVFLTAAFLPMNALRFADSTVSEDVIGSAVYDPVSKEETVYAVIGADGSVSSLVAVNMLDSGAEVSPGVFEDSAEYVSGSVQVLTPHVGLEVSDGKVILTAQDGISNVHYRGVPLSSELPFTFSINYGIDGSAVDPSRIAGLSGIVSIDIKVTSNPAAAEYFRENFVCQVQIPLSLDVFSSIVAPGSQKMIAGNTATYSYTILPGMDKDILITANASLFELQPITIACVPFDITGFLGEGADVDPEKLTTLFDASAELAQGASELSDGLTEMNTAVGKLSSSSGELVAGNEELLKGFSGYLSAVTDMTGAFLELSGSLTLTASQGLALHQGFVDLNTQLSSLLDMLLPLTASLPENDQQQIQGMASAIRSGLVEFESALGQYTQAIRTIAEGAGQLGTGMEASLEGALSVRNGLYEAVEGSKAFSDGLNDLYPGSSKLAKGAAELAEGQSEFAEGLQASRKLFDTFLQEPYEGKPVSFVNSSVTVNSVQFVLSTEAIRIADEKPDPPEVLPEKSFWQKFLDLFIGIFRK